MKKTFIALCAVVCFSALCFAQQPPKLDGYQRFTGTIETVVMGNAEKRILTKITAINAQGTKVEFGAKENTAITTKDGKVLAYGDLKKGDLVFIMFFEKKAGLRLAKSIMRLSG
jgi:hypothetical protein